MFRIKICGVTNVEDAMFAAGCGADAIGLNFYPKSKRFLEFDAGCKVSSALRNLKRPPLLVGVFVNESAATIQSIAEQVPLDIVQLHGDEPPAILRELRTASVIKAFRCKNDVEPAITWLREAEKLNVRPDSVLLDAFHPDEFGGTGKTIDLQKIDDQISQLHGIHWVLAGGLTPDNVANAIESIAPNGVDTASGVEAAPGKKSHAKIERFIRQAEIAFAAHRNRK